MQNGKIRSKSHMVGDTAIRIVQNIFPPEWVCRAMNPDYGVDIDLELFEYENESCITLGEHVFLQVKGTEHPQYGQLKLQNASIDVIKFNLEVSELNLVERMGSAFPVLLLLIDVLTKDIFYICLNDYIRKVLPVQNPEYKKQETVYINIPVANKISEDNLDVFKWYGKELKYILCFMKCFRILMISLIWM